MKSVFTAVMSFFESFGKARAATVLARMGQYEAAKRVMVE
jgi:hypothetical protein